MLDDRQAGSPSLDHHIISTNSVETEVDGCLYLDAGPVETGSNPCSRYVRTCLEEPGPVISVFLHDHRRLQGPHASPVVDNHQLVRTASPCHLRERSSRRADRAHTCLSKTGPKCGVGLRDRRLAGWPTHGRRLRYEEQGEERSQIRKGTSGWPGTNRWSRVYYLHVQTAIA